MNHPGYQARADVKVLPAHVVPGPRHFGLAYVLRRIEAFTRLKSMHCLAKESPVLTVRTGLSIGAIVLFNRDLSCAYERLIRPSPARSK